MSGLEFYLARLRVTCPFEEFVAYSWALLNDNSKLLFVSCMRAVIFLATTLYRRRLEDEGRGTIEVIVRDVHREKRTFSLNMFTLHRWFIIYWPADSSKRPANYFQRCLTWQL